MFYEGYGLFGHERAEGAPVVKRVVPCALPLIRQKIKPVERRLAEADAFLDLPFNTVKEIKDCIRQSARDFGELSPLDAPRLREPPPEIEAPQHLTVAKIQGVVARHYDVTRELMISQRRHAGIVRPRQIAMYLAKRLTRNSVSEIGRRFGGRDHTTVLHAVRKIGRLVVEDAVVAADVAALEEMLL